jgi:ATP-dependent Lon protease
MEAIKLPFLPLKGQNFILFPALAHHLDLTRPGSLAALKGSLEAGKRIVIGFFKRHDAQSATLDNLWEVGCEAVIKNVSDLQGSAKRVFVEGIRRVRLCAITADKDMLTCAFNPIEEPRFTMTDHLGELAMYLQGLALGLESTVAFQPMSKPKEDRELSKFVDTIANRVASNGEEKVRLLRAADARKRVEMLHMLLAQLVERENERMAEQAARDATEKQTESSVSETRGRTEATTMDAKDMEVQRLKRLLQEAEMPDEARTVATNELKRLQMMSSSTADYSVTVTYLDVMASLPWSKASVDKMDIDEARRVLNEDHYGLKEPKERILEFLAVRKLTSKSGGAILCFAGPPGVGKTSLGQSIARAMGRVFIRTSLGGVRDEAEIRGHRRTYIGALPGRILQEMRKAQIKNPVFMLDEIDKLGRESAHGDPASALLEVLDPEQNCAFKDNYLSLGFDLSQVFFIGTANDTYGMPAALRDRLEIVELPGYSAFAKVKIARSHLIPRQQEKNGLAGREVEITDDGLEHIIEAYTSEAGVRTLERHCGSIFRKLAVHAASDHDIPNPVDADMVKALLGPPKLFTERMAKSPKVGISTGLAWSAGGGSILFIESEIVPGEGKIELTGNLGQVIQESAKAAHTWIRANAKELGIDPDVANKTSIHVHIPAGGTPKDGPSAGVALAVSVTSLLSKIPVRNDIAMTGEISLRGRVMPVGGIVEKLLAAHRAGIREAIIPQDNRDSLTEIPEEIVGEMKIHLVDQLKDALDIALMVR